MGVLRDDNLGHYKDAIDELSTQVKSWPSYLSKAKTVLNSGTGSTFRTKYAKGKKASANIQTLIDLLETTQKDLTKLVNDANAFYTTSYNASKK